MHKHMLNISTHVVHMSHLLQHHNHKSREVITAIDRNESVQVMWQWAKYDKWTIFCTTWKGILYSTAWSAPSKETLQDFGGPFSHSKMHIPCKKILSGKANPGKTTQERQNCKKKISVVLWQKNDVENLSFQNVSRVLFRQLLPTMFTQTVQVYWGELLSNLRAFIT